MVKKFLILLIVIGSVYSQEKISNENNSELNKIPITEELNFILTESIFSERNREIQQYLSEAIAYKEFFMWLVIFNAINICFFILNIDYLKKNFEFSFWLVLFQNFYFIIIYFFIIKCNIFNTYGTNDFSFKIILNFLYFFFVFIGVFFILILKSYNSNKTIFNMLLFCLTINIFIFLYQYLYKTLNKMKIGKKILCENKFLIDNKKYLNNNKQVRKVLRQFNLKKNITECELTF
jgi:hypothetical protein